MFENSLFCYHQCLKHPYFHHTSDRLPTNQQHQIAIAPNLITKRSPKISILSQISDRFISLMTKS
ncbi:MAG: hypothetical protein ACK59J_10155 [Pseudanabaena sp.]